MPSTRLKKSYQVRATIVSVSQADPPVGELGTIRPKMLQAMVVVVNDFYNGISRWQ